MLWNSYYRKSCIKPPPTPIPRGGLFISNTFKECLKRRGAYSFNPDDGISSPQRTRKQSGKAQVQEVRGHVAENQKQIRTCSW